MKKSIFGCLSLLALLIITNTAFGAQRLRKVIDQKSSTRAKFSIMYNYENKKFNDLYKLVTSRSPLFIKSHLNCLATTHEYLELNELTIQDFIEYIKDCIPLDLNEQENLEYQKKRCDNFFELAQLKEELRILEAKDPALTTARASTPKFF